MAAVVVAGRRAETAVRASKASASRGAWSRGVGFEPDRSKIVSGGEADVGVERGGESAEQGDGGFGAAFFDALDLVVGHLSALGEFGDGKAELGADVVYGLAER